MVLISSLVTKFLSASADPGVKLRTVRRTPPPLTLRKPLGRTHFPSLRGVPFAMR
jgi:hypothetical protein